MIWKKEKKGGTFNIVHATLHVSRNTIESTSVFLQDMHGGGLGMLEVEYDQYFDVAVIPYIYSISSYQRCHKTR